MKSRQVNPNNHSIVQVDLQPGTYAFALTYNGTRDQKTVTISTDGQIVYFHTMLVNVELQAHDNSALDIPNHGSASYYANGWHAITTLNVNNHYMVTAEMLPGTYSFAVTYDGTRDQKTATVGQPNANTPASNVQSVYFHAALVNVELQAHDNSALSIPANGSASYYAGGWHAITGVNPNNHSIVQTEMLPGTYSFAATYNGTRDQKTYTVIEPNPNNHANALQTVYFHAALVTVALEDHLGNPLNFDSASYYASGWHAITAPVEMLPGTYPFALTYNGSHDQKTYTVIEPNPNNHANALQTVLFQTGQVTLNYSGGISWYYAGWHTFTKPSMEFLPGTTTFYFDGYGCQAPIAIASGDNLVKSMVSATLVNSSGAKLAGGDASAYVGGWQTIGTTNGYGVACKLFDGQLGNISVAMTYNGTHQQLAPQNVATNSIFAFQTTLVTVKLEDHLFNPLDIGSASYYAGGWYTIGDTSGGQVQLQMLPGSYSFGMTYLGTHEQLNNQVIGATPTDVVFQTGQVISDSNTATQYYAGGWMPFTNGMELLPGSYPFHFSDATPQTSESIVAATVNHIH